jgi:hypothetical protein
VASEGRKRVGATDALSGGWEIGDGALRKGDGGGKERIGGAMVRNGDMRGAMAHWRLLEFGGGTGPCTNGPEKSDRDILLTTRLYIIMLSIRRTDPTLQASEIMAPSLPTCDSGCIVSLLSTDMY